MLALKSDNKIMTVILTEQPLSKNIQPDFNAPCSRVLQFRQGFECNSSASTKKDVACFIECRIKDTPFCYKLLEISSPLPRRISPSPHYNLHIIIAGTGKEYGPNRLAINNKSWWVLCFMFMLWEGRTDPVWPVGWTVLLCSLMWRRVLSQIERRF